MSRIAARFLPVLTVAVLMSAARAEPFPPFDEGATEPAFANFRDELFDVVDRHDPTNLKKYLHPDVIESFGGNPGRDGFLRAFKSDPRRWEVLAHILHRGGRFRMEDDGTGKTVRAFYAPYTFFAEIPGSEGVAVAVLAGSGVPVYAAPRETARVVGRFNDEALEILFGGRADNKSWYEVKLPDGKSGFVAAKRVVLNTDFRAGFVKHEGLWKLRSFVAGD